MRGRNRENLPSNRADQDGTFAGRRGSSSRRHGNRLFRIIIRHMRLVTIRCRPASEVAGQTRIRAPGMWANPTSQRRLPEQSSGFCRVCHSQPPRHTPHPPMDTPSRFRCNPLRVVVAPSAAPRRSLCSRWLFFFFFNPFSRKK